jgi:hypothetical protein
MFQGRTAGSNAAEGCGNRASSKLNSQEGSMQMAISFMAVVAGMVFSLAIALLAEELIFGQVFRLFFARQPIATKSENTVGAQKA